MSLMAEETLTGFGNESARLLVAAIIGNGRRLCAI